MEGTRSLFGEYPWRDFRVPDTRVSFSLGPSSVFQGSSQSVSSVSGCPRSVFPGYLQESSRADLQGEARQVLGVAATVRGGLHAAIF